MQCPAGMKVGGVSELLTTPSGMNYLVFLPFTWTAAGPPSPVLLLLHGGGGVGNPDNVRGQSLTKMLLTPDYAAGVSHIVIIPVAPSRPWSAHFDAVLQLLDTCIKDLNGDA